MSSRTVGTCSICGGRVSVPTAWMGIYPPIPTCDSCDAHMKSPHGPVVQMELPGKEPKKSFCGAKEISQQGCDMWRHPRRLPWES